MQVRIDFGDEILGTRVISETPSGALEEKIVNPEDLQSLFQNTTVDSDWLPRVRVLRYMKLEDGDQVVLVLVPPMVRRVMVDTNRYPEFRNGLNLPMPYTILGFRLRNGRLHRSVCGCTKFDPIKSESNFSVTGVSVTSELARQRENPANIGATRIYQFPYGNVYSHDHKICWGNLELPTIRNIADVERLVEMFFSASINGDLFYPPQRERRFDDFLRDMDGKTELADDDYAITDLTLNTLLNKLKSNSGY